MPNYGFRSLPLGPKYWKSWLIICGDVKHYNFCPFIFSYFPQIISFQVGAEKADRIYEDLTDTEKIISVLQDYLDDYNITNSKDTKLVFFQDAIEHVSRYRTV